MKPQRSFIGPALIYALTNAISASIPFLMLPLLTRMLTPQEYGLVTAFTLAVTIFGALTGLSVHGAVGIRYFEQDKYNLPRYVAACLLILLATTTTTLVCVAVLTPWLQQRLDISALWLLAAVGVSGAQFVTQIQLVLWQSSGKPWHFGLFRIAQSLIDASLSLGLVIGLGMAWQGRVIGIAVASAIAAIMALSFLGQKRGIQFNGSRDYVADALRFGAPLVAHTLGGLLITTGDKMVVGGLMPLKELGFYTVATQVAAVLNILYDSFFKAFQPWIIENSLHEERRIEVVTTIYKALACTTLAGAAYYIAATMGYTLLVGEQYEAGKFLLLPLILASVIRCGYFSTAIFINVAGKNEYLAINTTISGILGLVVAIISIPRLGVVGAAMGVVTSETINFILNFRSSLKAYPMPWGLR